MQSTAVRISSARTLARKPKRPPFTPNIGMSLPFTYSTESKKVPSPPTLNNKSTPMPAKPPVPNLPVPSGKHTSFSANSSNNLPSHNTLHPLPSNASTISLKHPNDTSFNFFAKTATVLITSNY